MGWGCELRYRPKTQPCAAPVTGLAVELCTIPPAGWYCTRGKGHEGPCAAVPDPTRHLLATRGDVLDSEQRLAELIRANARADGA